MQTQTYSFWKSVLKMVVKGGLTILPLAVTLVPSKVMDATIGGVIYLFIDYLQKSFTSL